MWEKSDFCLVPILTNQPGLCIILVKRKLLETHCVSHGPESMGTEYSDLYNPGSQSS